MRSVGVLYLFVLGERDFCAEVIMSLFHVVPEIVDWERSLGGARQGCCQVHPRVVTLVGQEGERTCTFCHMVVRAELGHAQESCPVYLLVRDIGTKILFHDCAGLFCLPISPRVKGSG